MTPATTPLEVDQNRLVRRDLFLLRLQTRRRQVTGQLSLRSGVGLRPDLSAASAVRVTVSTR
jgi:ABC-type phosphate transport system auxiliary subunit